MAGMVKSGKGGTGAKAGVKKMSSKQPIAKPSMRAMNKSKAGMTAFKPARAY